MMTQLRFVVALAIAFCALTVAEDVKQPTNPLDVPRAPGIQPLPAKLPEGLASPTTEKAETNKQKRDVTETNKRPATPAPNRPVIKPAATGPRATDKPSNQQKPQTKPADQPKPTEHTATAARPKRDTKSQTEQQKTTPKPVTQKQTKLPAPGSLNHGSTNSRPVRDTTTTGQQKPQTLPGRQTTTKPQTLPGRPLATQKPQTLPGRPSATQKPQKVPAPGGQNHGPTNSRPARDTTNQNGQQKPQLLPAVLPTEKPNTQPAQIGLNGNRDGLTKPAPIPSNTRPARETDTQNGQKTPPPIAILLATEKPLSLPAQTDGNREGLTKPAPTPARPVRDTSNQNGQQRPQPLLAQLPTQKPNTLPAKTAPTAARPLRDTATQNGQQKPQTLPVHLPTQKPQTLPAQTGLNGNREGLTKPAPIPSNTRPARDTINQNGQQKPQPLPFLDATQKPQTLPAQIGLNGNREGLTKPAPIPSNTRPARDTVNQNGQQKPQPLPVLIATQKPQTAPSGTGVLDNNDAKPTPATIPPKRPVRETPTNKPTIGEQKPQTLPAATPKPTSTPNRPIDKKPLPNPGHF